MVNAVLRLLVTVTVEAGLLIPITLVSESNARTGHTD